ncbi:MAG: hypothetical protein A2806_04210 [Candidatus Terrybacteria bacterium RIFCSPHIGHO2_01_FULL_48_17]|uniref:Antitoxin n=1 Tax=Candidatus Terrybacteria bacterium RIFCSPHIGHO2_01_FULL_48_17 TaxID=1802362 RepID=A0A1G2PM99_9BACT|nr:MAG: hypothetical protein A2806_04210 [Candidatus Terrybacteria bacterium RIFCSPHIGHO2_01_FULL_48_17]OHA53724.1 MAG: hypothetical protein A3A30_05125 [Candidatus Terrybacteria bacterium RIFCSPLOWO2_01_FULL_48_14]
MNPVTIPKKITKGEELVILSRKEYERLSQKQEAALDRDLAKALSDVRSGRLFGPFQSLRGLKRALRT